MTKIIKMSGRDKRGGVKYLERPFPYLLTLQCDSQGCKRVLHADVHHGDAW
jgi:hypothetical protein